MRIIANMDNNMDNNMDIRCVFIVLLFNFSNVSIIIDK